MRLLHITPAYYPATYWGGPIFSVYALNNALAAIPAVKLTVLTSDAAGPKVSDRLDSCNVGHLYSNYEVIITRRRFAVCVSYALLKELVCRIRCADVVHLTAIYSFTTIPTLILCRLFDKPLIWSFRGAVLDDENWKCLKRKRLKTWWQRLCNVIIKRGQVYVHATSEEEKVSSLARLPKTNAFVIENGIDIPDDSTSRDWQPDGVLRLLYLGRIAPKKGIECLLEAMKIMNDSSIVLTICGTGQAEYCSSLEDMAKEFNLLGKSVYFAGHVDGMEKENAFYQADVCVVPSHSESFCMVVAEALAHGVPTIASHGTPWHKLEDMQCGLWVDNSPLSLAEAIQKIRKKNLEEMGAAGRNWMKKEFDWGVLASRMKDVYELSLNK